MSISAGVVIAVALHQIDHAPHGEASTEGDNESLQNRDCLRNECHKISKNISTGIMDGYSLNGTDAEKEKYNTIKKLLKTISTALEWAPIECAFTDKKCLKLALQNCGIDSC